MFIDYGKLHSSEVFFADKGFKRIEVPWWVPKDIMKITAPPHTNGNDYYLEKNKKCLVASAEQSFLYLANQGLLPPGKYQGISPCFRDESQGPMRRKFFMKNELIITDEISQGSLSLVIEMAFEFFKSQVPRPELLKVVKDESSDGMDIEYGGYELGSYGIRHCDFLDWVYATGCAEPRLSRAILAVSKR